MNRDEVLTIYGGLHDFAVVPGFEWWRSHPAYAALYREDFDSFRATISLLQRIFAWSAGKNNVPEVEIVVTASTSMRCAARKLAGDSFLILVPVGTFARSRAMSRVLMSYWNSGPPIAQIYHSLWDAGSAPLDVPPTLLPVLGDIVNEADYWSRLAHLDSTIDLDADRNQEVGELCHLLVAHLIWHEFAHVIRHHFDLTSSYELRALATTAQIPEVAVRRALECDADAVADQFSVILLIAQAGTADRIAVSTGFTRLGYVLTMLYGLYDPHKRVVAEYLDGHYPHPQVRHNMSLSRQAGVAEAYGFELFGPMAKVGSELCLNALNHLELDVAKGRCLHALRLPRQGSFPFGRSSLFKFERLLSSEFETHLLVTRLLSDRYGEPDFSLGLGQMT